jgi:hypothetical protein
MPTLADMYLPGGAYRDLRDAMDKLPADEEASTGPAESKAT